MRTLVICGLQDAIWVTLLEPSAAEKVRPRLRGNNQADLVGQPARHAVNVRLSFLGANLNPKIVPFDRLPTKGSYFISLPVTAGKFAALG